MKIRVQLDWYLSFIGFFTDVENRGVIPKKQNLVSTKKLSGNVIINHYHSVTEKFRHVWICIVPCLPIHIWWKKSK